MARASEVRGAAIRPARLRDTPRAAWVMARAFSSTSRIGRRLHGGVLPIAYAAAVFPFSAMVVLSSIAAGQGYMDAARVGFVVIAPGRSTFRESGRWVMLCTTFAFSITAYLAMQAVSAIPHLRALLVIGALVSLLLSTEAIWPARLSRHERARLRRTAVKVPAGPRWNLTLLAKIPGTSVTASRLAHHVLHTVPPAGAVVVITARTPDLHKQYARYGFTPTTRSKMFWTVP